MPKTGPIKDPRLLLTAMNEEIQAVFEDPETWRISCKTVYARIGDPKSLRGEQAELYEKGYNHWQEGEYRQCAEIWGQLVDMIATAAASNKSVATKPTVRIGPSKTTGRNILDMETIRRSTCRQCGAMPAWDELKKGYFAQCVHGRSRHSPNESDEPDKKDKGKNKGKKKGGENRQESKSRGTPPTARANQTKGGSKKRR